MAQVVARVRFLPTASHWNLSLQAQGSLPSRRPKVRGVVLGRSSPGRKEFLKITRREAPEEEPWGRSPVLGLIRTVLVSGSTLFHKQLVPFQQRFGTENALGLEGGREVAGSGSKVSHSLLVPRYFCLGPKGQADQPESRILPLFFLKLELQVLRKPLKTQRRYLKKLTKGRDLFHEGSWSFPNWNLQVF